MVRSMAPYLQASTHFRHEVSLQAESSIAYFIGKAMACGRYTAFVLPIPRLKTSGRSSGHTGTQSLHAVQRSLIYRGLCRIATSKLPGVPETFSISDVVKKRILGLFLIRWKLISSPQLGGQSLGKYF